MPCNDADTNGCTYLLRLLQACSFPHAVYHCIFVCLQAISLALSCLSFDFVGTCIDDSAEEMATIQVRH